MSGVFVKFAAAMRYAAASSSSSSAAFILLRPGIHSGRNRANFTTADLCGLVTLIFLRKNFRNTTKGPVLDLLIDVSS